jgi:tRNA pseudouridine38-40 synthase
MISTFKLTIEYDGTNYHGWQRQPDLRSIQETIETVLAVMTRQKVTLIGSGRTDAGVHALGQTAGFTCETRIEPHEFVNGLNSLLPDDIVIHACTREDPGFHARFDVKSKLYRYCILNRPLPAAIGRNYAWWIRRPLDLSALQEASTYLIGQHDFKAFEGAGSPRSDTIRKVTRAQWLRTDADRMCFEIEANGFLRYMVRNIVGTLVDVGSGKLTAEDFGTILTSLDRKRAGATAPAQGLFLVQVTY